MITDIDGNKIPYSDIMPNVGIIQSNNCAKNDDWNAILCHDIDHRVMGSIHVPFHSVKNCDEKTEILNESVLKLSISLHFQHKENTV